MPASTVRVHGLRDLQRAFKRADATLHRELRTRLREVAEPVRADAERMAVQGIPNIGLPWSRMRVGVTTKSVYIAPKQRGRQHRRPNLADLLSGRSMEPAIEQHEPRVVRELEQVLDTVARSWEHP